MIPAVTIIQLSPEQLQTMIQDAVLVAVSKVNIPDELITSDELRSWLKISSVTEQNYRRRGLLPYIRKGKSYFYKKNEVMNATEGLPKRKGYRAKVHDLEDGPRRAKSERKI